MITDFALPDWKLPPHERSAISDAAYLDWLNEERLALIRSGELEKLQADPARQPVDARFVWSTELGVTE